MNFYGSFTDDKTDTQSHKARVGSPSPVSRSQDCPTLSVKWEHKRGSEGCLWEDIDTQVVQQLF